MSISAWVVFDPDLDRTISVQDQVYVGVVVDVGPAGPPGPPGDAAAAGFTWVQAVPAAVWTVVHGLGYRPAGVVVVDSGGTTIEGDTAYPDANTAVLSFAAAFSGTAYLS